MTPREVIAEAIEIVCSDGNSNPALVEASVLAALAAEGLAIYDTATHAAVPREITKAMVRAADACCDADGGDAAIWQAMLTAAEAEAKGGE